MQLLYKAMMHCCVFNACAFCDGVSHLSDGNSGADGSYSLMYANTPELSACVVTEGWCLRILFTEFHVILLLGWDII
jgi:hypothetical protein